MESAVKTLSMGLMMVVLSRIDDIPGYALGYRFQP